MLLHNLQACKAVVFIGWRKFSFPSWEGSKLVDALMCVVMLPHWNTLLQTPEISMILDDLCCQISQ